MKKKINRLILILLFIGISCTTSIDKRSHCVKLYSEMQKTYNQEKENYIDFKKTFNFDWDKLYIVVSYVTKERIKERTGFDYENEWVPEFSNLYLFSYKGKIVNASAIDNECSKRYLFFNEKHLISDGIMTIESKNAKFKVLDKQYYYALFPLNPSEGN